jgi:hypothetical protein
VLVLPPADPNSWYIKDGKLYFLLFYGLWDWLETEPGGLDQSLAIASGRWRQCFGDIFETNFMFDAAWKSTSELGYPEKYCVDFVSLHAIEPTRSRQPHVDGLKTPRHRADAITTTSRDGVPET